MKLKMLVTMLGSENGIKVKNYMKGEIYDIGETLSKTFLKHEFAEFVKPEPVKETKIVKPKPITRYNIKKGKNYEKTDK